MDVMVMEKLTELLNNSFERQYEKRGLLTAPYTAADLIANGVTTADKREAVADKLSPTGVAEREWTSVEDGLPIEEARKYRGENGEDPEYLVMIKGGFVPTTLFFNGEYWYCNFNDSYKVTHWMPMPEAPHDLNILDQKKEA